MELSGGTWVLPAPPQWSSCLEPSGWAMIRAELGLPPFMGLTPSASVGSGRLLCLAFQGMLWFSFSSSPSSNSDSVPTLVLGSAGPTGEAKQRSQVLSRPEADSDFSASSWGRASPHP